MFKRETLAIAIVCALLVCGVGLAALFQAGSRAGEKRQAKVAAPIIKNLEGKLTACEASVANLSGSLELQNDHVDLLRSESVERAQRAADAIKRAESQTRTAQAKIDRLQRSKPSNDICASARTMIVQSLGEDRL